MTEFFPLPRSQATADIEQTKPNVKKQNSEILTGTPIKKTLILLSINNFFSFFKAQVIELSVPFHPSKFCELNIQF